MARNRATAYLSVRRSANLEDRGNLPGDVRPEVIELGAHAADRNDRDNRDQNSQQTVLREVFPAVVAQKCVCPRDEVAHAHSATANDVPGEKTQISARGLKGGNETVVTITEPP